MQRIQRSFTRPRAAVALLLVGALTACSSRDPVSTAQVSQFTLKSVDNHELPYEISQSADGSTSVVLTDLVLSVLEDQTWRTSGHERITTNGVGADQVVHGNGTFVAHDTSATFLNTQGDIVYEGAFIDTPPKFIITDSLAHVYLFCGTAVDLTLCQLPPDTTAATVRGR